MNSKYAVILLRKLMFLAGLALQPFPYSTCMNWSGVTPATLFLEPCTQLQVLHYKQVAHNKDLCCSCIDAVEIRPVEIRPECLHKKGDSFHEIRSGRVVEQSCTVTAGHSHRHHDAIAGKLAGDMTAFDLVSRNVAVNASSLSSPSSSSG
jgi:hypothetical protein